MPSIVHAIASLEGGGAERQVAMLASEQAARGWDVHLALRRGGPYRALVDPRVSLHWLGDHDRAHPRLVYTLARLLRRVRPDLVQTWLPQMDIVAGAVATTLGTPWVMTERTTAAAYPRHLAVLRRIAARGAAAIIANSRAGAAMWPDAAVIANAVDIAAVRKARPLARSQVLWVGRLAREKAPDVMVAASAGLEVRMIGDGPMRVEIHAEPFRLDWWGYLQTADVFASTSRVEGQPNTVLEAMAAGCPLVVTDLPAHREILDDRSARFVPADDPAAFALALRDVLRDRDLARERAEVATQRIALHSVTRTADAYEAVYARVLARARMRGRRIPPR